MMTQPAMALNQKPMPYFHQGALILEGGGLRGVYTSGVLHFLMDQNIYLDYVIGVSMGACNAANYVSRQPGRNRIVNTQFVNDQRYLSFRRLLRKGELFGMNFIFDTVPNQLVPFDYRTFRESPQRCVVTVTDCHTGEALYYDKAELGADYLNVLQASCSLPFIAQPVEYNGRVIMDGGLSDAIPLAKSISDGNRKHVLVLTQPRGYRKKTSTLTLILMRLRYPPFRGMQKALAGRAAAYNRTITWIDKLEDEGRVFVIRPNTGLGVKRVDRDQQKLLATYDKGYSDARIRCDDLRRYLGSITKD